MVEGRFCREISLGLIISSVFKIWDLVESAKDIFHPMRIEKWPMVQKLLKRSSFQNVY